MTIFKNKPDIPSFQKEVDENLPPTFPNSSYRESDDIGVYKRRWYILTLYCSVSVLQSLIYNTWGPIQATARAVYQWDDYVIDLIAAWGAISICVTMAPFAWLMDVKGLRISMLLTACLQLFGAVLRCIPVNNATLATALVHCGQIIANSAGPISLAGAPLLSSTWFPPHQRTTATAISTMACYIGAALSFIIGPTFVDDVSKSGIPKDGDNYVLNSTFNNYYQDQINTLLYTEAGLMLALFLAILVYFPATPPTPPSRSAATGRIDFKTGLKTLFKNYNFLLLVLVFGASVGCYGGLISVLDQCLSEFDLHVNQNIAGWLGFVAEISGSISGILFSLFADHFFGHLKLFLIVFMALSFYTILLIYYIFIKVIPFNEILVYVMFALNGFFLNGTIPSFFELGVEITYPVAEGVTSGLSTFSINFMQTIFLLVPLGHFGTKWMIWATVSACAASTIFLLFVRESYNRSSVDKRYSGVSSLDQNVINT